MEIKILAVAREGFAEMRRKILRELRAATGSGVIRWGRGGFEKWGKSCALLRWYIYMYGGDRGVQLFLRLVCGKVSCVCVCVQAL